MRWSALKRHAIRYISLLIVLILLFGTTLFVLWASSDEKDLKNNIVNFSSSVCFFIAGYVISAFINNERNVVLNTNYASESSYWVLAKITITVWIMFFILRLILMSPIFSLDKLVSEGKLDQSIADEISTTYGGSMGITVIIILCWFAFNYGRKYKNITVKEILVCIFIGEISMSLFFTIIGIPNISIFEIIKSMEINNFEHDNYIYFIKNYAVIISMYILFNFALTALFVFFYYLGGGYNLKGINQSSS
jgi:hypothetical protein